MKYDDIRQGTFISRPNRFIAHVMVDGTMEVCHVKNTGRCRELLLPQVPVYVQHHDNAKRKTNFSLISVKRGDILINMDSQAPNKVVEEWLKKGKLFQDITLLRPETKYKNSRFDFYIETPDKKIFIEVKGVTLKVGEAARFPDAPTLRGIKHINELCASMEDGYEAYIIFVIQMKGVTYFEPNDETQKDFGDVLREAKKKGVHILAMDCFVSEDTLEIDQSIPIRL